MGLLGLFRRFRSARAVASPSKSKPRGRIAAASLHQAVRAEPKEIADLAERMDRDYQVQLARRVLTANIQSVRVTLSVKSGDERASALADALQSLWEQTLPTMLDAVSYGRVAFEKVLAYDAPHNLLLTKSLDALPFRQTNLVLGPRGNFEGIDVCLEKSPVRIPPDKSWWLALDATVMEPHGRSQYLGAPCETFQKRQKTRRRFDTLLNRLSVRGMIAYHPLDEEDERGNRYDPGEVLGAQLDAMVAGGHLLLPNTRHPTLNDYEYKIQETTEVLDTAPMLAAITEEDAEQLRAFGIPEKTVTEGDAVGSHAMVKQQTLVLYAVVDGLLAQFTSSFQKYVIDKSIELNFDERDRPQITIGFARLAERPDSILAQVVTSILGAAQLNPLVQSGAIDIEQLLESAGIPMTGDVQEKLNELKSQQHPSAQQAHESQIPGGEASLADEWDESKHPRGSHGRFAKSSTTKVEVDPITRDVYVRALDTSGWKALWPEEVYRFHIGHLDEDGDTIHVSNFLGQDPETVQRPVSKRDLEKRLALVNLTGPSHYEQLHAIHDNILDVHRADDERMARAEHQTAHKNTTDALMPDGSVKTVPHSVDPKIADQLRDEGVAFHQGGKGFIPPEAAFHFNSEAERAAVISEYLKIRRDEGDKSEAALDQFQATLDIAGLLPGVGAVPDLGNAAISAARGSYLAASMSLLAAVPAFGDVATASKTARQVAKALDSAHLADESIIAAQKALETMADPTAFTKAMETAEETVVNAILEGKITAEDVSAILTKNVDPTFATAKSPLPIPDKSRIGARSDGSIHRNHLQGAIGENALARAVHSLPNETVIAWGDTIGANHDDVTSFNSVTGRVSLWDAKTRRGRAIRDGERRAVAIPQSETFKDPVKRAKAVKNAIKKIKKSSLSDADKDRAIRSLASGNYNTRTVGYGNVKNSVLE